MSNARTVHPLEVAHGCIKGTMANWKARKRDKANKGSQTPGKTKGENCMASGLDRLMAKRNRSYKHPYYPVFCEKKRG